MVRIVLSFAAAVLAVAPAGAADCPALGAAAACQEAVSRASQSYAALVMKNVEKCLGSLHAGKIVGDPVTTCRGTPGVPPTDPKAAGALAKAAAKFDKMVAKKCADADVASLQLCAPTVAGLSCLREDVAARVDAAIEAAYGALVPSGDAGTRKCQKVAGSEGLKLLRARLKATTRCLNERNAECGTPTALDRCLSPGDLATPREADLVAALAKAEEKLRAKIAKACSDAQVAALDACAATSAGLADCLFCAHNNAADLVVGGAYRAVRVANATTAIQDAADAAEAGDTILVEPGTYVESVVLKDSGLTVRGVKDCTTGARPLLTPPAPNTPNGIEQCGSLLSGCTDVADDTLIESLEAHDFHDNDFFAAGVDGITYRDLVARGPAVTGVTRYGVFPILSNDVVIESCEASGISDAALYVGQSTNIIVRNNHVYGSVAGIEIENSANAQVYGNHAHDNAGGILVFKLPGLPVQLSDCHVVRDNLIENNNGPNFGAGIVGLIPSGTGLITLSNDSSIVENNTITGNGTFGMAILDQLILNVAIDPDPFPTPSADQDVNDNSFVGNTITGNALDPAPGNESFAADVTFLPLQHANNCQSGNTFGTDLGGTFAAKPACPTPPVQPGCPFIPPPTTTSTSSTSTTSSTAVTTTSTTSTLPWTFSGEVQPLLAVRCGGCHGGVSTPQYAGLSDLDNPALAYGELVNVPSTQLPSMDRVEPGDPDSSYVWHKLNDTQDDVGGVGNPMPLGMFPLPQAELDGIRGWIENGALND